MAEPTSLVSLTPLIPDQRQSDMRQMDISIFFSPSQCHIESRNPKTRSKPINQVDIFDKHCQEKQMLPLKTRKMGRNMLLFSAAAAATRRNPPQPSPAVADAFLLHSSHCQSRYFLLPPPADPPFISRWIKILRTRRASSSHDDGGDGRYGARWRRHRRR